MPPTKTITTSYPASTVPYAPKAPLSPDPKPNRGAVQVRIANAARAASRSA
jgi:hypothetical protein